MASSSSSVKGWSYGVFLSFRGADTRNGFTGHLREALCKSGINVFIDNELQRGEVITSELLRVIEASRISIVVLSENYASSSFCLDEVVKILECRESKGQIVLPVFYHVDPTAVEEQTGTFGDEFAKLEAQRNEQLNYWKAASFCRYVFTNIREMWPIFDELNEQRNNNNGGASTNMDRVQKWRLALTELATLSGWHLEKGDHEATTIQSIVEMVLKQLDRTPLHVAEHPVGLASRVDYFLVELSLESDDVRMLGLHGMGGIGKTTTAKALYNRCVSQFTFDGSSFLLNVRETSKKHNLAHLQENLLFEILGDRKHLFGNFEKGIELIKERLGGKKVLIVIDDADDPEQLQKLAGELEWFGAGSRIIITTRDLRLLELHGVTMIHEIKGLEEDKAMELFSCWHAFKEPRPSEAYVELSCRVIKYARGLPLALKVLGSSLYGRDVPMWEDVLKKLKQCPNNEITEILKVSYDGLDSEEKAIFLDIACFLKGKYKDEVIKFLDACGFHANFGLQRLTEKSLVGGESIVLEMHDLLQEMGIQIALEESSRLCIRKQEDIRVFLENKRPYDIKGILLDFHGEEEVSLELLEELTNLQILIIRNGHFTRMPKSLPNSIKWLEWHNCSLKSIPSGFLPANLFVLEMPCSRIVHFQKAFMVKSKANKFMNLTRVDFNFCEYLKEILDFSAMPNLEDLDLCRCKKLKRIDKSIGNLKKLECMLLEDCRSLVSLPNLVGNKRLKCLHLSGCYKLEKLPYLPTALVDLQLSRTGIKEIPSYIGNLTNLSLFEAKNCEKLVSISESILKLTHLSTLYLTYCSNLTTFPEAGSSMISSSLFPHLQELNLWGSNFVTLPTCIFRFSELKELSLQNCKWLVEIPELPHTVQRLYACNCKSLERFSHFHNNFVGDFTNCHRLAENEMQSWRRVIFENLSLENLEKYRRGASIILPGNEIPQWFNHAIDIEGNALSFKVPPPVINDNFIGVACCAIFQMKPDSKKSARFSFRLFLNGYWAEAYDRPESEHMWLCYLPYYMCYLPDWLETEEISWEFKWLSSYVDEIVYKRVGVHFMYKNQR